MHGLLRNGGIMMLGVALATSVALAVEPPTIPTAAGVAASRCAVGQPCTFTSPVFACDYAGAEKIAAAGPAQGSEIANGLVLEKTCQTVPAGRAVMTEAAKVAQIVYLSDGGQHLGYMPVGVFASSGTGARAACDQPGFCAVRPGAQVSLCPTVESLALPTPEAKSAAKCLRISDSNAGEVVSVAEKSVTLANMFGGKPPYQSVYHAPRSDFVRLDLQPYPTPAARGWCRPETWCVTAATALFCTDKAAPARIEATPLGEPRRLAVQAEPSCRFVVGGGVLKPKEFPETGDPQKLVAVEHPTLGVGWANVSAFPVVAFNPPLRDTARMADIRISQTREPAYAAIDIRGQGTPVASGVFRSGPQERHEFCAGYWGEDQIEPLNSCLSEPDATITAKANCESKELSINGRRYGLFERPSDAAADIHTDAHRQMLYRDLKSREWLDGSTVSGEVTVATALNALCPGVDPEASHGLIYRDPRAQYPRALWGRWFNDSRACTDPRRNQPDYDEYV
ncbi:hypothetical protein PMNALOAF_1830 [Methylobacterium adhaesivum]|uniref:Secreted protein n=1 Tax=Methylobacterium adhaesivum TaxID=333297 RepID=A0ABT8BE53_9HYPH|nr:hypothetical protein [Methylobacterium adhaesivum]MDN3589568.1 hypothetical protein [Methylobacterium adhaesivum]GJD30583.1 hypothetical protein PMNALOAF_1830 [Methylobacterium adhaesivum]